MLDRRAAPVALPLLLSLGACAATPTYVTKQGLRVFDKTDAGVQRAPLETMVDDVVAAVGGAESLSGVDVVLIPEWIEISQMDGKVTRTDGYSNTLDDQVLASVFSDCLYVSGLVHEIAHVVHDKPRGVPDWTHDDAPFWQRVDALEQRFRNHCSAEQLAADAAARGQSIAGANAPESAQPILPGATDSER